MKDHQQPDPSLQHKAIWRREFLQIMGAVGAGLLAADPNG